ncbi:hypothetical protein BURPS668_2319 [Burkholderia pseudomallei 668]|nr:hypothetical protein BURPS668_2319 [Burkholderia pseudomallei 668]
MSVRTTVARRATRCGAAEVSTYSISSAGSGGQHAAGRRFMHRRCARVGRAVYAYEFSAGKT